jgi:hypothetical protein
MNTSVVSEPTNVVGRAPIEWIDQVDPHSFTECFGPNSVNSANQTKRVLTIDIPMSRRAGT